MLHVTPAGSCSGGRICCLENRQQVSNQQDGSLRRLVRSWVSFQFKCGFIYQREGNTLKLLLITPNNPYNIFRAPQMFKIASRLSKYMQVESFAAFPGLNLAILAAITPPHVEVQIVDESV